MFIFPASVFAEDQEVDVPMGNGYDTSSISLHMGSTPSAPSNTFEKGVDISKWNGTIDFKKLKNEVDFVIIRCGYGTNKTSHDDKKFETYVKGCRDNDIPYGIYLYSYATSLTNAKSEGQHALRLVKLCSSWNTAPSLPIFYDMEDSSQAKTSASLKGQMAKAFCDILENAGYKTGIYANKYWFNDYLTNSYFNNVIKWVAQYNTKCTYNKSYAIWQCTSTAKVSGISGNCDYNYMIEDIYVKQKNVSSLTYSTIADQKYTGSAVKPSITVKDGNKVLTKDKDYSIEYVNNTKTGEATIKITGQRIYEGVKEIHFNIYSSKDPYVKDYQGVYDGQAHNISVYNYKNGTSVKYSVNETSWSEDTPQITNVGNTEVSYQAYNQNDEIVEGSGTVSITAQNISKVNVSSISNQYYTGKKITPTMNITYNNMDLVEGQDYTLQYSNNTNLGTAKVTIKGINNFTGKIPKTFSIVKDLKKLTIGNVSTQTMKNKAVTPNISIKDGKTTLKLNKDYKLTYKNNSHIGTATMTITGIGKYTGKITKSFKIIKSVSALSISSISNKEYTGKSLTPSLTIKNGTKTLKKNKDYTLTYKNNKKTGKATITIKGKGNYTGSKTVSFYIVPKKVSISTLTKGKKYINVKYKKVTGASGYQISYKKQGSSKWTSVNSSSLSKKLTNLSSQKKYSVKVRAYKIVNGKKYYGSYSQTKTITTK
jgi:GH25 family lysozyme M1 (1,4-beta-N-acetylmuramidase)